MDTRFKKDGFNKVESGLRNTLLLRQLDKSNERCDTWYANNFRIRQTNLDRAQALRNTKLLSAHAVACIEKVYKRFPKRLDILPKQIMYRCYLLIRTMLVFELGAMLAPKEVVVDPFELFKTQGALIFNIYCLPDGLANSNDNRIKHLSISDLRELGNRD